MHRIRFGWEMKWVRTDTKICDYWIQKKMYLKKNNIIIVFRLINLNIKNYFNYDLYFEPIH